MPAVEDNKFIESVKNEYIRRGDVVDYVNKMRACCVFTYNGISYEKSMYAHDLLTDIGKHILNMRGVSLPDVVKCADGTYFKTNNRKVNSDEGHA